MRRGILAITTLVALRCGSTPAGNPDAGPPACGVVQTSLGPVQSSDDDVACSFLGIPYAAPPVGSLRWKPPQPAAAWTATRQPVVASACPQLPFPLLGVTSNDEDCLYLDVYVPNPPPSGPAPVMVFVHGGAFVIGAASSGLYDGAKLASATGAIVVTIQYRLGPFGFLSDAELRAEDPAHPSAGDYGIEDQIAALEWVKANAASFGGDPTNVTIFGESAGGTSMLVHLASPKSQGLFERAIVESAWTPYGGCAIPMATADQQGDAFATALGCTDSATRLACLRGKSADDVLAALPLKAQGAIGTQGADWLPVVEGDVLPDEPLKLLAAGSFARVPVVIGNNTNEGSVFFDNNTTLVDDASYLAEEETQYPGHGAAVVAQYPVAAFGGSYTAAAAEAFTDGSLVCGARKVARALVAAGVPTYRYHFARVISQTILPGAGAFHGSELLFVFGNALGFIQLAEADAPLSQAMMGYWGSMATSGDPNGAGRTPWPTYDATHETQLVLDLPEATEDAYKKAACDFWDSIY